MVWAAAFGATCLLEAADWQGGWYLDGGGYWARRVQVGVTNRTDQPMQGVPTPVPIGPKQGQADLVGAEAKAVRVAKADGTELLFSILAPDGNLISNGPIPDGATLLIPAECPPKGKSLYWIYFDNPLASQVPDFLPDRLGLVNGDLEQGQGDTPTGWQHDPPDAEHRTEWSSENPRSGQRCLKTVVAEGASPSWIAIRQSHISVHPGGRYRFRAWVRAEGVKGYAGWYLHLGNSQQPMLSAPMLNAGGGTYDWKQVELEFQAPAEADRLSLGTVLWGTGVAWFDQAELECLDPPSFELQVGPPEHLEVQPLAAPADWPSWSGQDRLFERRAVVRMENLLGHSVQGFVAVDISSLNHRLGGRLDRSHLKAVFPDQAGRPNPAVPPMVLGDHMITELAVPARSVMTGYIYYGPTAQPESPPAGSQAKADPAQTDQPKASQNKPVSSDISSSPDKSASSEKSAPLATPSQPATSDIQIPSSGPSKSSSEPPGPVGPVAEAYARLVQSARNLVKNASFEAADPLSEWTATPTPAHQKVQYSTDTPGVPGLGSRCARLHIPPGIGKAWRGWTQSVPVRPRTDYLVAAWIRTHQLQQGNAQVHLHIRTASGELSRNQPFRASGQPLQGTTDWTLLSVIVSMPEDAAVLQVHLTTDGFGTLWYDGVLVAEVIQGRVVGREGRPLAPEQIAVWPVNPIVKIFPDEPAPGWACRSVHDSSSGPRASASQEGLRKEPGKNSVFSPREPEENNAFPPVEIFLARNEQEPLQLAVRSGRTYKKLWVEVEPPRNLQGQVLPKPEVAVVGYVPVDYPSNYYTSTSPRWYRKTPAGSGPACDGFAGLWPDPLLPKESFSLSANQTQALWLTFQAPKEAQAGEYQGRIRLLAEPEALASASDTRRGAEAGSAAAEAGSTISEAGSVAAETGSVLSETGSVPAEAGSAASETRSATAEAGSVLSGAGSGAAESGSVRSDRSWGDRRLLPVAEVPYRVHVWNFTLPDQPHLKAIYDVRFGSGGNLWGKGESEAYREVAEFMARRRLTPDGLRPEPVFRYRDGRVEADFSEFDQAGRWYFDQLGIRHSYTPWHFYLFGWGHPPKWFGGESPYAGQPPYAGVDRGALRPEYKRLYQEALRLFWNHVQQKGWADRFVLYISDEPFFRQPEILAQMKALCQMIHEVDPAIPIYSSTWHHVPDWDESLDIWGFGHYGIVPLEEMARQQKRGKRFWFTTDGQMCLDTPYCAIERLLPHYCFQYGAEAYEFWGVAWTTYNPYQYGWHAYIHQSDQPGKSYWVRYPNGDGYLIYPGQPLGHNGPVSSIRLEQAREGVEDYEYLYMLRDRLRQTPAHSPAAQQAQKALQEAAGLLSFPNPGGRYSTKILPDPDRVLAIRRQLAEAIQALAHQPEPATPTANPNRQP